MARWSFPEHLHGLFGDMTPMPFSASVSFDELSPYSQNLHLKLGRVNAKFCNQWKSTSKLISTLHDRTQYWMHFRLAKLCHRLGIIKGEYLAILRFKQSYMMRDFVDLCNLARKESKDQMSNFLAKLGNNACYGKTLGM